MDIRKLNPEDAQKVIDALKDGKINSKEAEELKKAGINLTPEEQEALNKAFSSGEVQIGDKVLLNKGKSDDGKKQYFALKDAEKESDWKDTALDVVTTIGKIVLTPLMLFGSCTEVGDIHNNAEAKVEISIPPNDQSKLIAAMEKGFEELKAEMKNLGYTVEKYGEQIIELLLENNTYLLGIKTNLDEMKKDNETIIKILTDIKNTVDVLTTLAEATNENLVVLDVNLKAALTEIKNAILQGDANTLEALKGLMDNLKEYLLEIINNQKEEIKLSEDSKLTLDDILKVLQNIEGAMPEEQLAAILEVLQNIESIGQDISDKLDTIIGKFDKIFADNQEIKDALDRIEKRLKENGGKTDETNALLNKFIALYENNSLSKADLERLINHIDAAGDKVGNKIDSTNALLAKIDANNKALQEEVLQYIAAVGFDMNMRLSEILDAIKNCKGNGGAEIEALLKQVLEKMDKNDAKRTAEANAIIEAMSKLQVGDGGSIDLSSVEKMLAELIKLTEKNGDALSNLSAKVDVVNVTLKAIEEKLEKDAAQDKANYSAIIAILNAIKANQGSFDDKRMVELLNKISGQLDEIKALIKDHDVNVSVDVTGKVTCTCNHCQGGNNEGIVDIDKLNDLLN